MRSCDTCPGGSECAADNLAPVLAEIYALYRSGMTNKFDILFALPDNSEALFEKYDNQVSRICWTKATLELISGVLASTDYRQADDAEFDAAVRQVLVAMVAAFNKFPWYISGLIGQAPELYEAICFLEQGNIFASQMTKRQFVKLCKAVVYQK